MNNQPLDPDDWDSPPPLPDAGGSPRWIWLAIGAGLVGVVLLVLGGSVFFARNKAVQAERAERAMLEAQRAQADAEAQQAERMQGLREIARAEEERAAARAAQQHGQGAPLKGPGRPEGDALDEAFENAWTTAWVMAEQLDREEPLQTAKTSDTVSAEKRENARAIVAKYRGGDDDQQGRQGLIIMKDLGYTHWANRQSRREAKADPRFLVVARAIWKPVDGSQAVVGMANVWGMIAPNIRAGIADEVANRTAEDKLSAKVAKQVEEMGWKWPYPGVIQSGKK